MRSLPVARAALGVALLILAGCGNLREKQVIDLVANLEPRDGKFFPMTAPVKAFPVIVSANSEGIPIDLYLLRAGTEEEAAKIVQKQVVKEIITNKLNKANPKIEATIPADLVYGVYVFNADHKKEAKVSITLTEQ